MGLARQALLVSLGRVYRLRIAFTSLRAGQPGNHADSCATMSAVCIQTHSRLDVMCWSARSLISTAIVQSADQ
jgi:hypothetical protein